MYTLKSLPLNFDSTNFSVKLEHLIFNFLEALLFTSEFKTYIFHEKIKSDKTVYI